MSIYTYMHMYETTINKKEQEELEGGFWRRKVKRNSTITLHFLKFFFLQLS